VAPVKIPPPPTELVEKIERPQGCNEPIIDCAKRDLNNWFSMLEKEEDILTVFSICATRFTDLSGYANKLEIQNKYWNEWGENITKTDP